MNRKTRIDYLITTLCLFVSSFFLYGLVSAMMPPIFSSKLSQFLFFGCLGGFGFSAILSSIFLAVSFFSKRGLVLKIIAAILFPVSFAVIFYIGILTYIPYQIYNIVQIIKTRPHKEDIAVT